MNIGHRHFSQHITRRVPLTALSPYIAAHSLG